METLRYDAQRGGARLSTPERHEWRRWDGVKAHPAFGSYVERGDEAEAIREAERLLAETEPQQAGNVSGTWLSWASPSPVSEPRCAGLGGSAWMGHSALAEALAAFVGEEIPRPASWRD